MRKVWPVVGALAMVMAACGGNGGGSGEETTTPTEGGTEHREGDHGGQDHMAAGATCEPQGTTLNLRVENVSLDKNCLAAPAGQPFTIAFESKDAITHNLVILESHTAPQPMFRGDLFRGPSTTTYQVPPLKAGTFAFHCEVHPERMMGTFVVK